MNNPKDTLLLISAVQGMLERKNKCGSLTEIPKDTLLKSSPSITVFKRLIENKRVEIAHAKVACKNIFESPYVNTIMHIDFSFF